MRRSARDMAFLKRDDKVFLEIVSVVTGAAAILAGLLARSPADRTIARALGAASVASRAVISIDHVMDLNSQTRLPSLSERELGLT
jgi:hypothetical protein